MPYQGNECKEIRIHNNGMKKRGKSGEYKRLVRAMKQRVSVLTCQHQKNNVAEKEAQHCNKKNQHEGTPLLRSRRTTWCCKQATRARKLGRGWLTKVPADFWGRLRDVVGQDGLLSLTLGWADTFIVCYARGYEPPVCRPMPGFDGMLCLCKLLAP